MVLNIRKLRDDRNQTGPYNKKLTKLGLKKIKRKTNN